MARSDKTAKPQVAAKPRPASRSALRRYPVPLFRLLLKSSPPSCASSLVSRSAPFDGMI
jgi:hypothetical protein